MRTTRYTYLIFRGRNRIFTTSGYLLTSDHHKYNTRRMFVADSVGAAVGSLFPTSVELKIYYMLLAVHMLCILLTVLSRHIGHLVGIRLVLCSPSCILTIFRKGHQSVSVIS